MNPNTKRAANHTAVGMATALAVLGITYFFLM
jgi:hypothetical protein